MIPLRVCTVGAALWECHAVHDHGVLGRAVGTGSWGAERVIFYTALSRTVHSFLM